MFLYLYQFFFCRVHETENTIKTANKFKENYPF